MSANRLLRRNQSRHYIGHARNKISREAMLAYLHDPTLTDHDFMKKLHRADLIRMLDRDFHFHTKPRFLQLVCFILAIDYPGFCFFIDMGGGKTKVILDMVRFRKERGKIKRTLVVVPYPANTITWLDEAAIHAPDLSVARLVGTKAERDAALDRTADLFVINYMGLFVMMCDLVRELTDEERAENAARDRRGVLKKHRHKTGRRLNKARAELFASLFDCVVFDESQFIGGYDTDQFKLCRTLALTTKYSYVLSGTPFGRDPAPLWPQFFCADLGLTFGQKFTQFRAVFYDTKVNNFGIEYKFNNTHETDLRRMMRNRSIRFEDSEFTDLPPVTRQKIRVEMTPQMQPYYDQRRREMIDIAKQRQVSLIENKYHQLRAITSGYVIGDVYMEDVKVRVRSEFDDNPKLEALKSLLVSLPENRKITVYHEYIYTGDLVEGLAKKLKIKTARLGGGRKGDIELQKFLKDDDCRILVAQSKAGGVGTNLQHVCNYCVFIESPTAPDIRKQAESRFPRSGQLRRVFLYDIVMDETIDRDIEKDLSSGMDFLQRLLKPKEGR